ncbi:hypothetical protein HPB50_006941 [Hyalomma asiaticum]|uniref:Uncharacterized protein n=1 Tax=Hyalomma asiaticum TaxID=266040 RepID=A0ACB7T8S0_HYAAI|nr:hypothetical protein HPB50_006941 [Hyalomma asiaticum]
MERSTDALIDGWSSRNRQLHGNVTKRAAPVAILQQRSVRPNGMHPRPQGRGTSRKFWSRKPARRLQLLWPADYRGPQVSEAKEAAPASHSCAMVAAWIATHDLRRSSRSGSAGWNQHVGQQFHRSGRDAIASWGASWNTWPHSVLPCAHRVCGSLDRNKRALGVHQRFLEPILAWLEENFWRLDRAWKKQGGAPAAWKSLAGVHYLRKVEGYAS